EPALRRERDLEGGEPLRLELSGDRCLGRPLDGPLEHSAAARVERPVDELLHDGHQRSPPSCGDPKRDPMPNPVPTWAPGPRTVSGSGWCHSPACIDHASASRSFGRTKTPSRLRGSTANVRATLCAMTPSSTRRFRSWSRVCIPTEAPACIAEYSWATWPSRIMLATAGVLMSTSVAIVRPLVCA